MSIEGSKSLQTFRTHIKAVEIYEIIGKLENIMKLMWFHVNSTILNIFFLYSMHAWYFLLRPTMTILNDIFISMAKFVIVIQWHFAQHHQIHVLPTHASSNQMFVFVILVNFFFLRICCLCYSLIYCFSTQLWRKFVQFSLKKSCFEN